MQGDYMSAYSLFKEGCTGASEIGVKQLAAWDVIAMGAAAAAMGQAHRGARLIGGGEAAAEAIGTIIESEDRMVREVGIAAARAGLGEEEFEKTRQEGRAMSMEQAIKYALEGS
jgi:hypothetical protein